MPGRSKRAYQSGSHLSRTEHGDCLFHARFPSALYSAGCLAERSLLAPKKILSILRSPIHLQMCSRFRGECPPEGLRSTEGPNRAHDVRSSERARIETKEMSTITSSLTNDSVKQGLCQ